MTKAEAVRQLKKSLKLCGPPASPEAIEFAISALQKEKKPAPSANDASPKENLSKKNDSMEKAKCQEAIDDVIDRMTSTYNTLTPEERRIWDLGEAFRRILDIQRMIEVNNYAQN